MCGTKPGMRRSASTCFRFGTFCLVEVLDQAGLVRRDSRSARRRRRCPSLPRGSFFCAYSLAHARRLVADVLHDLDAGRLQDRIVDVLAQQARVVAAPGADDALLGRARRPDDAPARRAAPRRRARARRDKVRSRMIGLPDDGLFRIASRGRPHRTAVRPPPPSAARRACRHCGGAWHPGQAPGRAPAA